MSKCRYRHLGPAVKTGFHVNQYWVCQSCKEEVSEFVASLILEREAEDKKAKEFVTTAPYVAPVDGTYIVEVSTLGFKAGDQVTPTKEQQDFFDRVSACDCDLCKAGYNLNAPFQSLATISVDLAPAVYDSVEGSWLTRDQVQRLLFTDLEK